MQRSNTSERAAPGEHGELVLLVDASVTGDARNALNELGFATISSTEVLGHNAPDRLIAEYADRIGAVVVNSNPADFSALIRRRAPESPRKLRFAGRITLKCKPHREPQRLRLLAPMIRTEHTLVRGQSDKRLMMTIRDTIVVLER